MNVHLRRAAADILSGATFGVALDFIVGLVAGIPLVPLLVYLAVKTLLFRTWTGRLYGMWLNRVRQAFGVRNPDALRSEKVKYAADYTASSTFAAFWDFTIGALTGIPLPQMVWFVVIEIFLFRTWTARVYGRYVNWIRTMFSVRYQKEMIL